MVKVVLETETGRRTELMPECLRMRDVLDRFHADAQRVHIVNGACLREEDMARYLREFSEDDEVRIVPVPAPEADSAEGSWETGTILVDDSNREILSAMHKIQEALNEAYKALIKQSEELPF